MNRAYPIPVSDIIYSLFQWKEVCKTPALSEAIDESINALMSVNDLMEESEGENQE